MFGGKASKTPKNAKQVNGSADVSSSDLYIKQLHEFLSKNSDASLTLPADKVKQKTQNSQPTYLKHKCKRAVYRFMKGLFDERKLKKSHKLHQEEPIYFEVSSTYFQQHLMFLLHRKIKQLEFK